MATYDQNSDCAQCIAYVTFPKPRLPIDLRTGALFERDKQQPPVSPISRGTKEDDLLFHDTLLESAGKSQPRNPWAAAGSLAFQLLLLAALVVIPLFHTEVLPKRETLTMLIAPPSAAASGVTRFRLAAPTYTSKSISVPNPVHKTQETPPPPVDTAGGVVGGVPGGLVGGVPGAALSDVLNGAHGAPVFAKTLPTPKRMRIASRVAEANLIHDVAPSYPPEAGRSRIEGTVVLMAVIAKDGTVRDVRVESGLPMLAQAAIDAVRQWRYRPYLLNGEPIEVDSQITINFTLSKG